jgi:hypothetical protein
MTVETASPSLAVSLAVLNVEIVCFATAAVRVHGSTGRYWQELCQLAGQRKSHRFVEKSRNITRRIVRRLGQNAAADSRQLRLDIVRLRAFVVNVAMQRRRLALEASKRDQEIAVGAATVGRP